MGFNFPNAPTTGQLYPVTVTPGLPQYRWDGEKWKCIVAVAATASVFISDTAPAAPVDGMLWWESDTGNLYVRYNDGDSTQWVIVGQMGSLAGLVRYDTAQTSLSESQRVQARQNIYAAPFDALAYNGLQVNGSTEISQERGNASFSLPMSGGVSQLVDGWFSATNAAATLAITAFPQNTGSPNGYSYNMALAASVGLATLAAGDFVSMGQCIEGYRTVKLGWGAAGAQPLSVGFWVLANASGTACLAARNNDYTRSYIAEFPVSPGWVWQTVTIPGCTDGTWLKTNGVGIRLNFTFAAGSTYKTGTPGSWQNSSNFATAAQSNFFTANGQVVYMTGLMVLPGLDLPSAARAPLISRSYDQEIGICQRYYYQLASNAGSLLIMPCNGLTDCVVVPFIPPVAQRATPAITHPMTDANFIGSGSIGASQWGLQGVGTAAATKTSGTIAFNTYTMLNDYYLQITGAVFSRATNIIALGTSMPAIKADARLS